jgi:hypothetical protein
VLAVLGRMGFVVASWCVCAVRVREKEKERVRVCARVVSWLLLFLQRLGSISLLADAAWGLLETALSEKRSELIQGKGMESIILGVLIKPYWVGYGGILPQH